MNILKTLVGVFVTVALGYGLVVELPKIASLENADKNIVSATNTAPFDFGDKQETVDTILREKCNDYVAKNTFRNGGESDAFLDSCLKGNETSKISVFGNTSSSSTTTTDSRVSLTQEERISKCNDFMSHATFTSKAASDLFLKNCLAGK